MPSWWGRSSSKDAKKKTNRESIIDKVQRKLNNASEEKCNDKSRRSRRHCIDAISVKGSRSIAPSQSSSPSMHVSRCQSFAERCHSQPLPLPGLHLPAAGDTNSGINLTSKLESAICSKPSLYPLLPKPGYVSNKEDPKDVVGDIATASVSSDSSIDSGDSFDLHLVCPLASDCENGNIAAIISSFSVVHKNQSLINIQRKSRPCSKPAPQLCNNKPLSTTSRIPLRLQNLQIARPGGLCSAPASSMSSPSRGPMRAFGPEQMLNSGLRTGKLYPDTTSGHYSSPGSGFWS